MRPPTREGHAEDEDLVPPTKEGNTQEAHEDEMKPPTREGGSDPEEGDEDDQGRCGFGRPGGFGGGFGQRPIIIPVPVGGTTNVDAGITFPLRSTRPGNMSNWIAAMGYFLG